ncbi:MAG: protein TolB [Desulfobulbaceae bacterium]|nr:protein TolB [Desulfobulbaceae bacterium]
MLKIHRLSLLLLCLLIIPGIALPVRAEKVYLDISNPNLRKLVVAVPYFTDLSPRGGSGTMGREMAELLSRALEFHGFAEVVDPLKYGGGTDADWTGLGVDYVLMGRFETAGSGMMIEGKLFNVSKKEFLAGLRYRGSLKQQKDMVLRLCDAFVEQFTGNIGVSRTKIAYVSDRSGYKEVYMSDVLGMEERQVTRHRNLVVSPRLSRDGRYLAYSSYHAGNQNLYLTDLRQDKITTAISRRKGMNLAPAWSPDNKSMVVTMSQDGSPDLYLMSISGQIIRQLTKKAGINVSASWAPDGSKIVFVSDRSGSPQLYTMDMHSYDVQRLTFSGSENSEPSWSPTGDLIAFTGLVDGHYQLFTIDPAGKTGQTKLYSDWGDCESPSWSPDGKQLVFSRHHNGKKELCVISRYGKNLRVFLERKGNLAYPQWSGYLP